MASLFRSTIEKFNMEAEKHLERQKLNPFSGSFSRSPSPRPSDYGKPLAGSKTEERGKKAKCHILKEILDLCTCICDLGRYNEKARAKEEGEPYNEDHDIIVTFKEIFQIYTNINDKVVGLLIAAKKRGFIYFEKEILFQRQDDDVLIALMKPIAEIRDIIYKELSSSSPNPQPKVSDEKPSVDENTIETDKEIPPVDSDLDAPKNEKKTEQEDSSNKVLTIDDISGAKNALNQSKEHLINETKDVTVVENNGVSKSNAELQNDDKIMETEDISESLGKDTSEQDKVQKDQANTSTPELPGVTNIEDHKSNENDITLPEVNIVISNTDDLNLPLSDQINPNDSEAEFSPQICNENVLPPDQITSDFQEIKYQESQESNQTESEDHHENIINNETNTDMNGDSKIQESNMEECQIINAPLNGSDVGDNEDKSELLSIETDTQKNPGTTEPNTHEVIIQEPSNVDTIREVYIDESSDRLHISETEMVGLQDTTSFDKEQLDKNEYSP